MARASLFATQAIARDLIAAGHEDELHEICEFISGFVRDPASKLPTRKASDSAAGEAEHGARAVNNRTPHSPQ